MGLVTTSRLDLPNLKLVRKLYKKQLIDFYHIFLRDLYRIYQPQISKI